MTTPPSYIEIAGTQYPVIDCSTTVYSPIVPLALEPGEGIILALSSWDAGCVVLDDLDGVDFWDIALDISIHFYIPHLREVHTGHVFVAGYTRYSDAPGQIRLELQGSGTLMVGVADWEGEV
jgi:hypothetical protein